MHSPPQLVIVGTSHRLQAGHVEHSLERQSSFQAFIERLVAKYSVEYVAEEMVETVLRDYGVSETLVRKAAVRCGKRHDYIDLSEDLRGALGVDRLSLYDIKQSAELTDAQFAVFEQLTGELREYVWLVRLLRENSWPTLFVCGATHAQRVSLLFNSVGILTKLEDYGYEP